MTPFDRLLQAAQGYLELGLPREAAAELDEIEPAQSADWRVRVLRVDAYQKLGEWARLETVARQLCEQRPDEAQWLISLAYAVRRTRSVAAACSVLAEAVERFPSEPIIHFNLACYEAQLGRLDLARSRLAEAVRLEPACRQMALAEPDLAALHDELA